MGEYENKAKVRVNLAQEKPQNVSIGVQALEVLQIVGEVLLLILKVFYAIGEAIYRTILPLEPSSVTGKLVLITGTGHGIGRELATLYASEGATVVGWDINEKGNEETKKQINKLGFTKFHPYQVNVCDRKEVFQMIEKVKQQYGDVSILINNAGIMPTYSFLDQTQDQIERVFSLNCLANCWMIQAVLPMMKKNNSGHLVAMSSCAGLIGLENLVPYCGTKFAVKGMMEGLHEEFRRENINVDITIIFPYMTDTGLCKKPRVKFEKLMGLLEPKYVARKIMEAQRSKTALASVPGYFLYLNNIARLLPMRAALYLKDFFDSGVDPES